MTINNVEGPENNLVIQIINKKDFSVYYLHILPGKLSEKLLEWKHNFSNI